MFPRPVLPAELASLTEIDGTVHSPSYLHLNRVIEGQSIDWRLEKRTFRDPLVTPNRLSDDIAFAYRQIAGGIDEGVALCIEMDAVPAAAILAQPQPELGTLRILDIRVDFDFRRQGLGTALLCAAIAYANDAGHRALAAETPTDNYPAIGFLRKLAFEPAGLDTHRYSNHDLVKERATLLWCLALK